MGNCFGGNDKSNTTQLKPVETTKPNTSQEKQNSGKKEVKVVFLGSGETGKSTMFRQIRYILGQQFNSDEMKSCREAIFENILLTTREAIKAILKLEKENPFEKEQNKNYATEVMENLSEDIITDVEKNYKLLYDGLISLWSEPLMNQLLAERAFYFYDGAQHFCKPDILKRITPSSEYQPTYEDTLYSRIKTIGIVEVKFEFEGTLFTVTDVGGQRAERKKWNQVLENTTAILYVASLAEFDQNCYEDGITNRMLESIELFEQSINGNLLKNATVCLILNKKDIFQEKIQKKDLSSLFQEYKGGNDEKAATEFIIEKYRSVNKHSKDRLHIFTTSAVQKDDFSSTFDQIKKLLASKAK